MQYHINPHQVTANRSGHLWGLTLWIMHGSHNLCGCQCHRNMAHHGSYRPEREQKKQSVKGAPMNFKRSKCFIAVLAAILCAAVPVLAQIGIAKITGGTVE
jgi:hypothetical protein